MAAALIWGGLCGPCPPASRGRCPRAPRPTEPIELVCAGCNGGGCDGCTEGRVVITDCPLDAVPGVVWQVIDAALLLGKGLPPVGGGLLDQAAAFLAAANQVAAEKQYWIAKMNRIDWDNR